jgi:hypothetical protein
MTRVVDGARRGCLVDTRDEALHPLHPGPRGSDAGRLTLRAREGRRWRPHARGHAPLSESERSGPDVALEGTARPTGTAPHALGTPVGGRRTRAGGGQPRRARLAHGTRHPLCGTARVRSPEVRAAGEARAWCRPAGCGARVVGAARLGGDPAALVRRAPPVAAGRPPLPHRRWRGYACAVRAPGRKVSLFILPRERATGGLPAIMGYETATWRREGRTYAAVAGLAPADLARLADYLERHAR